jgi:hypothetical protein
MAVAKGFVSGSDGGHWWTATTLDQIERALRIVQGLAIFALILLFFLYSIPFGKNLRGIALGYGLFIAETVVWLTFHNTGSHLFRYVWFYLNPMFYFGVLLLWTAHLWSYQPAPEAKAKALLEPEYQLLAQRTNRRLQEARGYLSKAVGS